MIEKLIGPSWLDQDDVTEAYVNKVEKALSIAWLALDTMAHVDQYAIANVVQRADLIHTAQHVMEQIEGIK